MPPSRPLSSLRGLGLAVVFSLAAGAGCRSGEEGLRAFSFQGPTMGTTYTVKVVAPAMSGADREEIERLIESELEGVNSKMSHYLADSELSRFNRLEDTIPFPVSGETFEVFRQAQDISVLSGGAFDITVAPLVDAWGFGPPERRDLPPSEDEIQELLARVGYSKIELDATALTLRKKDPDLRCDLSAIAKGYAVDRVAEALQKRGLADYMVEVGGEVRTLGVNDRGQDWRIGIERPLVGDRVIERVISVSGVAVATSGDYRNYYEVNGVRLSHTIDPRTGHPIAHRLASATVLAERCARADGLATALMVLGPEKGYQMAVDNDLAVLLMVKDEKGAGFRELATPAFERRIHHSTP